LADDFSIGRLHGDLNALARTCVPWLKRFSSGYHWSLLQVEYAFDITQTARRQLLAPLKLREVIIVPTLCPQT
jgi:hypothetical protein